MRHTSDFGLLILDCSVTMCWCFEDEVTPYTHYILDQLDKNTALVPAIWPLEVASVLLNAERHKRISHSKANAFHELLNTLAIKIDETIFVRARTSIFELARETKLPIYDATYLELAITTNLPLATYDKALIKAAHQTNVKLFEA